jgi:hypothetical protein
MSGDERPYDVGIGLTGELGSMLTEVEFAGVAYRMWGFLTDGIGGPPRYARGLSGREIEDLTRLAAHEWLSLEPSRRDCAGTLTDGRSGRTRSGRPEMPQAAGRPSAGRRHALVTRGSMASSQPQAPLLPVPRLARLRPPARHRPPADALLPRRGDRRYGRPVPPRRTRSSPSARHAAPAGRRAAPRGYGHPRRRRPHREPARDDRQTPTPRSVDTEPRSTRAANRRSSPDGSARPPPSRLATEAQLDAQPGRPQRMTDDQIAAIVDAMGGLLALLRDADPRDKAEIVLDAELALAGP